VRPHRVERVGGRKAHDLVAFGRELLEAVGRRDRDGEDQAGRAVAHQAPQCRFDSGAGRNPVVDDDDLPAPSTATGERSPI
jgi:hypothetical protein